MPEEKKVSIFLAYIVAALSNCALYSDKHPAVEEFSRKALAILEGLFVDDVLNLTVLAESIIFNDTPLSDIGTHTYTFIKKLRVKGIDRLVIKKGVGREELHSFIKTLASREGSVSSSPNIAIGVLEVRFKAEEDTSAIMEESTARVKEVYDGVSRFRRLDVHGLEDVVVRFITALKREASMISNLNPVREHSLYTYVHEANVSVLTIFQAEALGLSGELLHDAGLAGLLHDVGKLFIPKEIIEKQAKLDESEWNIIKLHPVYGALYLSKLQDVPELAVVAAYEHHMKYNGMGYPKSKRRLTSHHLISQLVAISDFFDALRTQRAYRPSFGLSAIIGLLREGSGTDFNPVLVDNFLLSLKRIKAV